MESPVNKAWGAHGWTSHEFWVMILDVQIRKEVDDRKITCEDCGRIYMVPATYDAPSCPRCMEAHNGL